MIFSLAVTEGIGYESGRREHGMKLDFIDVRKAFFHADARIDIYICGVAEGRRYGRKMWKTAKIIVWNARCCAELDGCPH